MPTRQTSKEDTMALRVPKAELPTELRERMLEHLGVVPEPAGVLAHNLKVALASVASTA
jgi:hypothetical protein